MLWRAAVNWFEHRMFITNVSADRESQAARSRRAVIADDVARQIGRHDHVVPFRIANLPLAEGVDVSVIEFQVGKFVLANFAKDVAEETVRADNVRFINTSHLELFVSFAGEVESETHDPFSRATGDANGRDLTALDVFGLAGIGIFSVFANDDIIDFAGLPHLLQLAVNLMLDSRVQLDWTDVRVKIQLLPIADYLRETGQLWFGIWLSRFGKHGLAVHFLTHRA